MFTSVAGNGLEAMSFDKSGNLHGVDTSHENSLVCMCDADTGNKLLAQSYMGAGLCL